MKFVFRIFVPSLLVFGAFIVPAYGFDWTQCEEKEFVLTAYYSPRPDQAFYYKSDYDAEKRLNGEGTHGANGEKVFNGMLAAPSSYEFGTKIYFPGFGLGKVADRGGAIVEAGERHFDYDRIDVWMGYGEEGLIKALDFGVQKKTGYVCEKTMLTSEQWKQIYAQKLGFDFDAIPVFKHFFDLSIWKQELSFGRRDVWVWTLQKYLVKLGYLSENKNTGRFDEATKKALCAYQTKHLISYPEHAHCGVFGPKTRIQMKKDVETKGLLPQNLWQESSVDDIIQQAKARDMAEVIIKQQSRDDAFFDQPFARNEYHDKVVRLQYLLAYLGHYDGEVDGVYDALTSDAVYRFQLAEGILNEGPQGAKLAGYAGPATRDRLNKQLDIKRQAEKLSALEEVFEKPKVSKKIDFSFYRAYTKGEGPNAEIRVLQNFLTDLKLYSGSVHGIYDKPTVDSVYQFQITYGLLDEKSHYTVRGYLGPGTRNKINEMRSFAF